MIENILHTFFKRSAQAVAILGFLRGVARFFPVVCGGFFLLGLADYFLDFSALVRQILWFILLAFSMGVLLSGFWPLSLFTVRERSRNLSRNVLKLREDDFYIARQFLEKKQDEGISSDLKYLYLSQFTEKIKKVSPFLCFPFWNWRRALGIGAASILLCFPLATLWPNVFFPFSSPLERLVRVAPGHGAVAWGGDVHVNVTLVKPLLESISLYVKGKSGWEKVEPAYQKSLETGYAFNRIIEPLTYRVRLKNDWGEKYVITPMKPVLFESLTIDVTPPLYLKRPPSRQSSMEITGLAGTQVVIDASVNKTLTLAKAVFSYGEEKAAVLLSKQRFRLEFTLSQEGTYVLELFASDGSREEQGLVTPLHVVEDNEPVVVLLSPSEDLIVGDREKLPLTYEAKDDFGVRETTLIYGKQNGETVRRRIELLDPPKEAHLSSYEWDLGIDKFKPGDVVRYQLEVADGNTVTGPGKAVTPWRLIEIASFEQTHAALEGALEEWRNKTVDLLAELNTAKAALNKENPKFPELALDQARAAQHAEQLERMLKQIVTMMEKDPLADYNVWLEHNAMKENLSAMNQGLMKDIQAALQTKNKEAASQGLEEAAAELERMAALSEELSKTQKASDVMEAGEALEGAAEDLLKQLETGEMEQVKRLMDEAFKQLSELARAMKDFPQELPEDFINQEALKNLEMGKSQDLLSQLNEAIKQGNTARAMELAKSFLSAVQKMKEQLGKAHEEYLSSNSAEELTKKISAEEKKLDEVIQAEQELLRRTQALESKRLEGLLKAQKKELESLLIEQENVLKKANEFVGDAANHPRLIDGLRGQLRLMEEVLAEMKTGQLRRSVEWLNSIVESFRRMDGDAAVPVDAKGRDVFADIRSREEKILEKLKKTEPPASSFSPADEKEFMSLRDEQKQLADKTNGIRRNLQNLSRKTANLGIPLTTSLGQASDAMNEASSALHNKMSKEAQAREEQALEHLQNAGDALSQAQSALGQMSKQQGGGGQGGSNVIMRGGSRGQTGLNTDKVRLPKLEDYRPPKAFREELLESLKEKYPKAYEEIIHKYYKRLSD